MEFLHTAGNTLCSCARFLASNSHSVSSGNSIIHSSGLPCQSPQKRVQKDRREDHSAVDSCRPSTQVAWRSMGEYTGSSQ